MSAQKFHQLILLEKKEVADKVTELRFQKPPGIIYSAGQFVQFKIPVVEGEVLRSYSISSQPSDKHLEFCIKFVPGGKASTFFSALAPGQSVEASDPKGSFVCALDSSSPKYFVATGVGLTPIVPMLESRLDPDEHLDLLFGVRDQKDFFWIDRLEKLKTKFKNFNLRLTLTGEDETWNGLRGRVTKHLSVDNSGHYYLCGNIEMVKDVRKILLEKGVPMLNIHFEIF